jgi:hypothetical protein
MENNKKKKKKKSLVTAKRAGDLGGQHMPGFHENRSVLHFAQDISLEHIMSQ